jgi:hypothetical protein
MAHLSECQLGVLPFAAGMSCTKLGERRAQECAGLGRPLSRRQPAKSRVGHRPGQINFTRFLTKLDAYVLASIEVHMIGEARQTGYVKMAHLFRGSELAVQKYISKAIRCFLTHKLDAFPEARKDACQKQDKAHKKPCSKTSKVAGAESLTLPAPSDDNLSMDASQSCPPVVQAAALSSTC